jgi:uncharacterized RDD family membrane protein YckC
MIRGTMAVAAAGGIRSERAEQARIARFARAIALLIDMLVFGALSFAVNSVYGVTQITSGSPISGSVGFSSYSTTTAVPWYILTVVGLLYFTVPEALFGATPGKWWARLRVVGVDGSPLSLNAVLTRNVMRLIDYLPVLYLLGGLSVLLTTNSQRLGDRLAGTTVVWQYHALDPGATRSSSPQAKRIAGIVIIAASLFTVAFSYFGRPPLVLEGLQNQHVLMGSDVSSVKFGSPEWSWGRVTYPVTGVQTKSGFTCNGSVTLEWRAFGWQETAASWVCRPDRLIQVPVS